MLIINISYNRWFELIENISKIEFKIYLNWLQIKKSNKSIQYIL